LALPQPLPKRTAGMAAASHSRGETDYTRDKAPAAREHARSNRKHSRSAPRSVVAPSKDLYVRYYAGHRGRYGHEFIEFEFNSDGVLRYANGSGRDSMLRREVRVGSAVLAEVEAMVISSGILRYDDSKWPEPNESGRQELEIILRREHVSFEVSLALMPSPRVSRTFVRSRKGAVCQAGRAGGRGSVL
jgi:hypothetical protein